MEKIVGTFVRIYVKENQRCEALALKMDITDFVEYKAFEGYIFDKKLHTLTKEVIDHDLPIIIEFFTTDEKAQKFLDEMAPYLKNTAVLVFRDTVGYFFR
jgi:PII-like signaling protein